MDNIGDSCLRLKNLIVHNVNDSCRCTFRKACTGIDIGKPVHPSVGPNHASIPPAGCTAQESDSRSNVSLATQFFQQPARRTVLARSRLQGNSTTQAVNRSLASFYACDALGTHDATGTTVTVFQRVLQCAAATLCQSGNLSFEPFQFQPTPTSATGFDRIVCGFA